MDINTIQVLIPLIAGPLVGVASEAARRVPVVPFNPRTAAGMRVAVAAFSVLAGVGLAYLDGQLVTFNWDQAFKALLDAVVIYTGAVATHDHALKGAK